MGKVFANFTIQSCCDILLRQSLFTLKTMNLVVVVAFVAVFASQSEAWVQPNQVCAAYFKAIGIDRTKFPSGKLWEDKVCVQDPSFYVSCKLFNRITHGSHSCIDCVIGECHQCLCRDALKWSFNSVATVVDPNNKAGNQYLVCEGTRITCHACPKGLVWNCRLGVCARTAECPPTPAKCQAYGCPATAAPLWSLWPKPTEQPWAWNIPTPVRPYGMTKQQCICREALRFCTQPATCVCDPYAENGYLECRRDRTVVVRSCAAPTCWNYLTQTCSNTPLCRPIPAVCKAL